MSFKKQTQDNQICEFKYIHIFDILKRLFKFDSDKYGSYIKDVIYILEESRRNGETFIEIDKNSFYFDLIESGWPEKHINVLNECKLINNIDSPFIIYKRKISWVKWYKKVERVKNKLVQKSNNKKLKNNNSNNKPNSIEFIRNVLDISDLILIEGGPGTGKSTLVIKSILDFLAKKDLNIGLAAPTGKATSRLKDSIDSQVINKKSLLNNIECQTIHSWIDNSRYKLDKLKFKLNELDILVIDEMSMVSLEIFELVLSLISIECKLILVGDPNQLPPINSCSIWNYIFENLEENPLLNNTLSLKKVFRNNGDIIILSKSITNKNNSLLLKEVERINSNINSNVKIYKSESKGLPALLIGEINDHLDKLRKHVKDLSSKEYIFEKSIDNLLIHEKESTNKILKVLNEKLILCQRNNGNWSVNNINEIIIGKNKPPYDLISLKEGTPIMCTKNNNSLGIYNGDIGVLIGLGSKRKYLFRKFNENNEPIVTLINPSDIENIIPAIALTIHKSQGSESQKVIILWENKSKLKTKEQTQKINFYSNNHEKRLLYTGITRAKSNLDLYYY